MNDWQNELSDGDHRDVLLKELRELEGPSPPADLLERLLADIPVRGRLAKERRRLLAVAGLAAAAVVLVAVPWGVFFLTNNGRENLETSPALVLPISDYLTLKAEVDPCNVLPPSSS